MELVYVTPKCPSTLKEAAEIISQQAELIHYLLRHIAAQDEKIKLLEEKIKDLERRLNLDSNNSSKPPSSDGPKKDKRPPISSRGKGKKPGGQKGHVGKTQEHDPNPTEIIVHKVEVCKGCQADLREESAQRVIRRQEMEVVITKKVIEHQAEVKKCQCGCQTTATFPDHITSHIQYGDTFLSIGLYLSQNIIGKDRLSQTLEDIFQIPISDTTIFKHEEKFAEAVRPFYNDTLSALQQSPVVHLDETGLRCEGKTHWMHVLCTTFLTYLYHNPKRRYQDKYLKGIMVHDHFSSYLKVPNAVHAFCNAHILRELEALATYDKELWARRLHILLRRMNREKRSGTITQDRYEKFSLWYDTILREGFQHHEELARGQKSKKEDKKAQKGRKKRAIGHNLLLRLQKYKEETLRFAIDEKVPFTNNQAERDLRIVKLKQKVSGCFRTKKGAENFAIITSYLSTIRKSCGNILASIQAALRGEVNFYQTMYALGHFRLPQVLCLPPPT